ncbi:MAG: CBS domain-containing protein [Rhodospirillaceae bacterium]
MSERALLGDLINPETLVIMSPDAMVPEASRKMMEHRFGLVVVQDGDNVVGVVTERDINFRVIAQGLDPEKTRLRDIMSNKPFMISPDTDVFDALRQVVSKYFRYAVIGSDGRAVGVVAVNTIFAEVTKSLGNDIGDIDRFILGDP